MKWLKQVSIGFIGCLNFVVSFFCTIYILVDSQAEALASYRLGSAFESTGDSKTAINVFVDILYKMKHWQEFILAVC